MFSRFDHECKRDSGRNSWVQLHVGDVQGLSAETLNPKSYNETQATLPKNIHDVSKLVPPKKIHDAV